VTAHACATSAAAKSRDLPLFTFGHSLLREIGTGIDPTGDYEPVVCTNEAFAALTHPGGIAERRRVDFCNDLLPLVFAEMQARYLICSASLAGGAERAARERSALSAAWQQHRFAQVVEEMSVRYGRFDPASHLFASLDDRCASGSDYESGVYDMVAADLDESLAAGGSPVKAAQEVLRILRDQLRSVIEFGGLTLESYIDFQSRVRGRINRMDAGPPPMRSQQLLALMDAGVVRICFGPIQKCARGPTDAPSFDPPDSTPRPRHGHGCGAGPLGAPLIGAL